MQNATCAICVDTFNRTIRKRVVCEKCNIEICVKCIKRYISEHLQPPHCMQCKTIYTKEFMNTNFSERYRKFVLKNLHETLLVQREKQYLPELMHRAEAKKTFMAIDKQFTEINKKYILHSEQIYVYNQELQKLVFSDNFDTTQLEELKRKYQESVMLFKETETKRNELINERALNFKLYKHGGKYNVSQILECIQPDCKGYLDDDFKCGLCHIQVCKDCYTECNDNHVCDKNNVESVKLIREETRPCPNCRKPIYKIVGCDQMFCTMCHTAFDWNTGNIEMHRIHNPHYYEWLRQRNQQLPREMGDVPCGGLPNKKQFESKLLELSTSVSNILYFKQVLNMANTLERKEVIRHPARIERTHEQDMININYLCGIINECTWKRKLFEFEKKKELSIEYRLLLDMILAVLIDYFNILQQLTDKEDINRIISELDELRKYYNKCIDDLNYRFDCKKLKKIEYDWSKLKYNVAF